MNSLMECKIEITSEYRKVVKENDKPVIVIIFANWCGTCQIMVPILENMAIQYKGKIKFVMVDTDTDVEIAKNYGLDKLPILLFFREGNLIDKLMGILSYSVLDKKIKTFLEVSSTNNKSNII